MAIIRTLFKAIGNLLAFLLIKAGLWLSALYALIFVIVCAVQGLSITGGRAGGLIAGAVVLAFVGIGVTSTISSRNKGATVSASKKRTAAKAEADSDYLERAETASYKSGRTVPVSRQTEGKMPNYAKAESYKDLDKKYFGDSDPAYMGTVPVIDSGTEMPAALSGKQQSGAYVSADSLKSERDDLERRLLGIKDDSERPILFALKKEPGVYVLEYKDRLEYYKKKLTGMKYIKTEYKY